jgi:hypothetical protein
VDAAAAERPIAQFIVLHDGRPGHAAALALIVCDALLLTWLGVDANAARAKKFWDGRVNSHAAGRDGRPSNFTLVGSRGAAFQKAKNNHMRSKAVNRAAACLALKVRDLPAVNTRNDQRLTATKFRRDL